ncbi:MAG: DUF2062 domain-containing protein [Gammaproteobacteria bacterium]|nr:DUF2062 domain-containing protein [Gammaproteobacteria bacterium]
MKKHLKKITPSKVALEKQKMLKPIAHWIAEPKIWHFNRRAIAAGVAIGLFFGSLPIAGQMFLSAIVAVFLKSNMPIAIVATWISNPITMPFMFTANYYLGAWLLRSPKIDLKNTQWTLESMMALGGDILIPLYFGSIVVGIILAMLSIIIIRIMWRISIVMHFHERKNRRQK